MCIVKQKIIGRGDNFAVDIHCEITEKPITITNEHGMYCADRCGLKDDIAARDNAFTRKLNNIMKDIEW